jgi:hypothetical protein
MKKMALAAEATLFEKRAKINGDWHDQWFV